MARKEIGVAWNGESRNAMNDNFKEVFTGLDNAAEKAMEAVAEEFDAFKAKNDTNFLPAVATVAERDTKYPKPVNGDTVRVTGEAAYYRFEDGRGWIKTDQYNPQAIDQVNQQLADKASQLELDATGKRIDELIIGSGNANAEVTDAHVSVIKNKTFTTLRNRLEESESDIESLTGVSMENELQNATLSNGVNGWTAGNSRLSASDGALKIAGDGGKTFARAYQAVTDYSAGDVLWVQTDVRATSPNIMNINTLFRNGLNGTIYYNRENPTPANGVWAENGTLFTVPSPTPDSLYFISQANYASNTEQGAGSHEIKNMFVINLSRGFGKGNEPTREHAKNYLSTFTDKTFDGTLRIGSVLSGQNSKQLIEGKKLRRYLISLGTEAYEVWQETRMGKWIVYDMRRDVNVAANNDSWRISTVRFTEIDTSSPLAGRVEVGAVLLTSPNSQWEYAIQPEGAPDFMGGFHGDELLQSVLFLVEGKPITLNGQSSRQFDRFEMVQHTVLYDPSTPANKLGDMYCRHIFTDEGMRVKFDIGWTAARDIGTAYAGMLPALRSASTTTKGRFVDRPTVYDISAAGHSKPGAITYGAELWNDSNGVSMAVEFDDERFFNGFVNTYVTRGVWISDSQHYNKVYPTRVVDPTRKEAVKAGDKWSASFLYRFDYRV